MDLKDLYRDVILDHNKRPRNFGALEPADARAEGHNPLCGDRLTVTLRLAGVITQVLPNGNLVVAAKQEVRVNNELRDLTVAGIIRSQDIASDNTVHHDRMAEARIAYGGRGTLSYAQSPRLGQQILDTLLPF